MPYLVIGKPHRRRIWVIGYAKGLPDVHYSNGRRWISGNMAVSEWLLTGTGLLNYLPVGVFPNYLPVSKLVVVASTDFDLDSVRSATSAQTGVIFTYVPAPTW